MIELNDGDKLVSETLQRDKRVNVVFDMTYSGGTKRIVGNVLDVRAFYLRCRNMLDNPVMPDYANERSLLIDQKNEIELRISEIDIKAAEAEAMPKRV